MECIEYTDPLTLTFIVDFRHNRSVTERLSDGKDSRIIFCKLSIVISEK